MGVAAAANVHSVGRPRLDDIRHHTMSFELSHRRVRAEKTEQRCTSGEGAGGGGQRASGSGGAREAESRGLEKRVSESGKSHHRRELRFMKWEAVNCAGNGSGGI